MTFVSNKLPKPPHHHDGHERLLRQQCGRRHPLAQTPCQRRPKRFQGLHRRSPVFHPALQTHPHRREVQERPRLRARTISAVWRGEGAVRALEVGAVGGVLIGDGDVLVGYVGVGRVAGIRRGKGGGGGQVSGVEEGWGRRKTSKWS